MQNILIILGSSTVEYRGVPSSTELSSTSRYNINHIFIIIQIDRVYVL